MKYDFDIPVNRRNTGSLKWDVPEKELPMWVADMDFETAPEIREAIEERASHGIYGYCVIPEIWNRAYRDWWKNRHGLEMEPEWLTFCTGVVPAISSVVRKLTTPAERVVLLTPVYNIFFHSVLNNGRQVLESPLWYDGTQYRIDFEDLEGKLADSEASMLILCNPHNPTGNLWDKDTLEHIGELCKTYHVLVVSDEIHCDLTEPGKEYVPFASVSEICREISITCIAPTKAFNLAGIQTAAVMVPNETLRHRVRRGLNTDEVAEPNVFAVDTAVAAFRKGADWLDALRGYLLENRTLAETYIRDEIPHIKAIHGEATYLLWLNCSGMIGSPAEAVRFIREETGLFLSGGMEFGGDGRNCMRMNLACPRSVLTDGLSRLKTGISAYEKYVLNRC